MLKSGTTKSRKDSKGRVFRAGETERRDGLYACMHTVKYGTRRTVCVNTLQELRKLDADFSSWIHSEEILDKT